MSRECAHPRPRGLLAELRRIRIEKGIAQGALCTKIGIEQDRLSTWECGRNQPVYGNLQAWANALGYELALVERA